MTDDTNALTDVRDPLPAITSDRLAHALDEGQRQRQQGNEDRLRDHPTLGNVYAMMPLMNIAGDARTMIDDAAALHREANDRLMARLAVDGGDQDMRHVDESFGEMWSVVEAAAFRAGWEARETSAERACVDLRGAVEELRTEVAGLRPDRVAR